MYVDALTKMLSNRLNISISDKYFMIPLGGIKPKLLKSVFETSSTGDIYFVDGELVKVVLE